MQDLEGKFENNRDLIYYNGCIKYTPEMVEAKKELDDLESKAKEKRYALESMAKMHVELAMPEKWQAIEVKLDKVEIAFKMRCYGASIDAPEPEEKPATPMDPYERIRTGGHMTQILNCGVLSKAEKRRVLGLPEEEKPTADKDGRMPF